MGTRSQPGVWWRGLTIFLAAGLARASAATEVDTVVFRNGDRISGRLEIATRDSVQFTGLVTGSVSLRWSDIQELRLASSTVSIVSTEHLEGSVITAPSIEVAGTRLHVTAAGADDPDFPLEELISVSPEAPQTPAPPAAAPPAAKPSLGGALKISPESAVLATQRQFSLAGGFNLGFTTGSQEAFLHQTTTLGMEANYTDSRKAGGAAVITELYSGILQQNVYLRHVDPNAKYSKNGPYLYGIANYYHNLSLGMNLAQEYGGGIGWSGSHGPSTYTVAADLRYLNEDLYAPGKSLAGVASGLTEEYSYTFRETGITIGQRVLWLPVLNHSRAYQLRATASIDVPISTTLSFGFSYLDDYLENAPAKSLPNYAKFSFDFKYTIGAAPKPACPCQTNSR
jgi:hypothetical protein